MPHMKKKIAMLQTLQQYKSSLVTSSAILVFHDRLQKKFYNVNK